MPQPRLITRPTKLTIHLPSDVAAQLTIYLLDPVLGRVPKGAYQDFFVERIQEYFSKIASTDENHEQGSTQDTRDDEETQKAIAKDE